MILLKLVKTQIKAAHRFSSVFGLCCVQIDW